MKESGIREMLQEGETFLISGSVAYELALNKLSDVDIRILNNNPKQSFSQKIAWIGEAMAKNKYIKKVVINNFYDEYPAFDEKKKNLLWREFVDRNFLIHVRIYQDDSLTDYIDLEFHIAKQKWNNEYEQLKDLSDEDKEKLLEIKNYVYTKLPFFWNRSVTLYDWFLAGNKTIEDMMNYLKEVGYEKRIK